MVAARQELTKAEFAALIEPGRFDLVDGELWSLPPNGILEARCIRSLIFDLAGWAAVFGGEVFSGEVGFELDGPATTVLCPDVAYVRAERTPGPEVVGFFPGPPDLAVELVGRAETQSRAMTKLARYLEAGARLVWCIYPDQMQVVVYSDDEPPRIFGIDDVLDGGDVLPGFELNLAELFA
jgi:Uma2 family endonuclease